MTGQVPSRRQIEPLAHPPGSFDLVLGRARARRYRRLAAVSGITGVFLAGIWGGLALGGGVSGVQSAVLGLADRSGQVPTQTPSDTATSTAAVAVPPTRAPRPTTVTAPLPVVSTSTVAVSPRSAMVRGRVVDPAGSPVAGMYIYTGTVSAGSFVPRPAPSAVSGVHGRYAVPCTGEPVLLTPWLLNTPLGATAGARWGAELVASPACSRTAGSTVTTLTSGATIAGHVRTDVGCADIDFPLRLWLGGDRTTSVRLANLNDGDTFRISGLPAGNHVLAARGQHNAVTVGSRTTLEQDVTFACPEVPPSASPTATPLPSPSETGSPTPSPTGSASTSTPAGAPSPTPTITGR